MVARGELLGPSEDTSAKLVDVTRKFRDQVFTLPIFDTEFSRNIRRLLRGRVYLVSDTEYKAKIGTMFAESPVVVYLEGFGPLVNNSSAIYLRPNYLEPNSGDDVIFINDHKLKQEASDHKLGDKTSVLPEAIVSRLGEEIGHALTVTRQKPLRTVGLRSNLIYPFQNPLDLVSYLNRTAQKFFGRDVAVEDIDVVARGFSAGYYLQESNQLYPNRGVIVFEEARTALLNTLLQIVYYGTTGQDRVLDFDFVKGWQHLHDRLLFKFPGYYFNELQALRFINAYFPDLDQMSQRPQKSQRELEKLLKALSTQPMDEFDTWLGSHKQADFLRRWFNDVFAYNLRTVSKSSLLHGWPSKPIPSV